MHSRSSYQRHYVLRLLSSTVIALLVVIACFKLPFRQKPRPVGWSNLSIAHSDGYKVVDIQESMGGPITVFGADITGIPTDSAAVETEHEDKPGEAEEELEAKDTATAIVPQNLPVLDFAELMPAILGGIGAYYVHIEYPEEAIQQGIEGLLILTFTVNTDGSTSHIEVTRPLHPLCDSAAVQALRRTAFIPGEHDGQSVRVRMRLPVRFQLIEPNREDPAVVSELTTGASL